MKQIVLLSLIALSFSSCYRVKGSGNIVSEKKDVGNFTGISAGGAFEVEVHAGSPASVVIEADDNLMKFVQVKVTGNILRIHSKSGVSMRKAHLKAIITTPGLDYIEGSGAANVTVVDELKNGEQINLHASGAARLEAKLDAPKIDAESSGAANIDLSGKTKDLDVHASGSASIHAGDLLSENAVAKASGAASVHVYASVKLNADASGSASVNYKGGAAVTKDESGAGSVEKEGE